MTLARLGPDTVVAYLQLLGLMEKGSRAQVRILDLSRRNHNLAVEIDGCPTWFVKQIQYETPEVMESLGREAHCYMTVQADASLAVLHSLMPRCARFDSANAILVLECLNGINAAEMHSRAGSFDVEVAEEMGRLMGTLHRSTSLALETAMADQFPKRLPWVLQPFAGGGDGSMRSRFLSFFVADAAMAWALAILRANWRRDTIIHGDARPENFIFCPPADGDARPDVKLVDWELADIGDAAWDCANVMQYYWTMWLSQGVPTSQRWTELQVALRRFWSSYIGERGCFGNDARRMFWRALQFTGARLVQTAYEHFASSGHLTQAMWGLARLLLTETDHALHGIGA